MSKPEIGETVYIVGSVMRLKVLGAIEVEPGGDAPDFAGWAAVFATRKGAEDFRDAIGTEAEIFEVRRTQ